MAATSFYPTKNLAAMGDGGAIVTDDEKLAERARRLRDYGQASRYCHTEVGYNSRLDELQAALLRRVQLPRLSRWTEQRRNAAARYIEGIRHDGIRVMGSPSDSHSCWHLFPVRVKAARKRDFLSWLRSRDVVAGEHYPIAIPDQIAMRSVAHEVIGDCPRARCFARSEVSLPIHPYLSEEEIARVIDVCNAWGG
jgi:dTDP-3-amino-3,4,6-trideoxy-alpha-D-glucose transaminase